MFPLRSHLDFPHVASGTSHLPQALSGPDPVVAGLGADAPGGAIPAPVATDNSVMLKRLAVIGGIALVVYFILRQLNKSKG